MRLKKVDGVKVQQAFLLLLKKGDQQYMNIWRIWIYDDLKKKKARLGPAPDQDLKGSKVYINFSNNYSHWMSKTSKFNVCHHTSILAQGLWTVLDINRVG